MHSLDTGITNLVGGTRTGLGREISSLTHFLRFSQEKCRPRRALEGSPQVRRRLWTTVDKPAECDRHRTFACGERPSRTRPLPRWSWNTVKERVVLKPYEPHE